MSARVVITTVGPYVKYGDPLVATRAEAGTDYVDLTGEPEFVDRTYVVDHARAVESGARIVHACGFDSIPHDLGAYLTVKQLPDGVPVRRAGFVRTGGRPSGGIFSVRGHGVLAGRGDGEGEPRAAPARAAPAGSPGAGHPGEAPP